MWRGRADKEAAFGKEMGIRGVRRGVLVTGRSVGSYPEQRDGVVSTKLFWSDAGRATTKKGVEVFSKVHKRVGPGG